MRGSELAHAFVDEGEQIFEAIRYRRIDAVVGSLAIVALCKQPFSGLLIKRSRQWNEFGEDLDFFVIARPAGKNNFEQLLKRELKRQLEIGWVDHQCAVAEAMPIFIVAVEKKDP